MRFFCFWCLLVAGTVLAQTTPSTQAAPAKTPSAEGKTEPAEQAKDKAAANVAPDAPVITVKGVCDKKVASGGSAKGDCQTVLTRAQFEKLADAIQPNMPANVRQRLASAYPRLLVMAHEAEKRGLDKQPRFQETMQFMRLQILNQELTSSIQEEAAQVPDKDIAEYYRNNSKDFEQVTLQRMFLPLRKHVEPPAEPPKEGSKPADSAAQDQAAQEAMSKESQALQKRAAAGEDFDKLQKEGFEAAGFSASQPSSNIGKMRRNGLAQNHASVVFELKAGEVSQVIDDASGHYIYKVVAKEVLPLDQVKEEIHNTLQSQRYKDAMQNLQQSATTELNDAYFGNAAAAAPAPPAAPKGGVTGKQAAKTPSPQSK
jgi:PPIC-type PPIASE domain